MRMNLNCFRWRPLDPRAVLSGPAIFVIGVWSRAFDVSRILREDRVSAERYALLQDLCNGSVIASGAEGPA
jgi:hypothetical protein